MSTLASELGTCQTGVASLVWLATSSHRSCETELIGSHTDASPKQHQRVMVGTYIEKSIEATLLQNMLDNSVNQFYETTCNTESQIAQLTVSTVR